MHVFNVFYKTEKTCVCFFICKLMFLTCMVKTVHKPASIKAIAPKTNPHSQNTTHDRMIYDIGWLEESGLDIKYSRRPAMTDESWGR